METPMTTYAEFLNGKRVEEAPTGIESPPELNPMLFDFQRDITRWALRRGRAAVFADCGLGKTPMQLEWASHVPGRVLIVAPLAVAPQTVREGEKFGVPVVYARRQEDAGDGVTITNYEMVQHFDPAAFEGVVLDESSILKSYSGHYRQELTERFASTRFRLCCTATPAPNDLVEIINHAEFLGVMGGKEIIALFFTQDGNTTHKWRLKGHAREAFWRWLGSWAVAMRRPEDLGYPGDAFVLPELHLHEHVVEHTTPADGFLFALPVSTIQDRRESRRNTIGARVARLAELVEARPNEKWLVWCDLNAEAEAVRKGINGFVEVRGADSLKQKEEVLAGFATNGVMRLVTKPTIAGFGVNWQCCRNVAFLGLSDSYEQFYQAVRRCWRFGQTRPVDVHVVISSTDGPVRMNIERKERQSREMFAKLVANMGVKTWTQHRRDVMTVDTDMATGPGWELRLGDAIERTTEMEDDSVGLSVFSPPFPGMYAYTNAPQDVGNCQSIHELLGHFSFLVPELLRITMPGRSCCVHLTQEVIFKMYEGYSGLRDFRGDVIRLFQEHGWIYASERTIDKDPQLKAVRTKDHGLAMKTAAGDSAALTGTMPDYLLQFRKKGENPRPVKALRDHPNKALRNPGGEMSREEWIQWASAVWYGAHRIGRGGIRESDVLCSRPEKAADDEKPLCPLQLGVIERCVKLWSAPGDLVFSPFAGIGSEGVMAVRLGRRFSGIELKRSYWQQAQRYLQQAVVERGQHALFSEVA